jgi:hypothetical protein
VSARDEPTDCGSGDDAPLQAMERVSDGHELARSIRFDVLGAPHDPPDVVDAARPRFRASEFDGFGFLIDGPYVREVRRETERDLAGTAREIQQPARASDLRAHQQIVEERLGIRESELVVEAGRPAVQIRTELGLARHAVNVSLAGR